jgi:DNA ligase-1
VERFARLLDRLLHAPQRNAKLALLEAWLASTPDPDRGWGLAALTGTLSFRHAKPGLIRALAASRVDPVLFAWSYDFVGDLAETTALIWPESDSRPDPPPAGGAGAPTLTEVVQALAEGSRGDLQGRLAVWLDALDPTGRWALLKLVTGGLRVGVSAGLARLALARHGKVEPAAVEELWHAQEPPYTALLAWLDGHAAPPATGDRPVFRPLMLAQPLEDEDLARFDPLPYAAEWKWDGIRVQIAAVPGEVRLYSRTGDPIGDAFPDIVEQIRFHAVLDGELLVARDGVVQPFNDLQQRLNRKTPDARLLDRHPAWVRLYDILQDGPEDLRALPWTARRARLEAFLDRERPARMDLSPLVPFGSLAELDALRRGAREGGAVEGLMLKRKDSPYLAGRPKGPWFKWKRDPHRVDCVLMYAQRGHGKRSSYYSDYTFGAWRDGAQGPELVPVGKAYFGFTDEELKQLDSWIRRHTTQRFGPVREVAPALVLEIAFDSIHRSSRHKSGVAMRFPRVARIRWDKPAAEADRLEHLVRLIGDTTTEIPA